jgi:hypothetical protein
MKPRASIYYFCVPFELSWHEPAKENPTDDSRRKPEKQEANKKTIRNPLSIFLPYCVISEKDNQKKKKPFSSPIHSLAEAGADTPVTSILIAAPLQ